MTVTLDKAGSGVTVHHKITNQGLWAIDAAPWALSVMSGGGRVIIPQEPYRSHDDYLLPARPMVLWHYTDLSDPRFTLGKKYVQLRTDAKLAEPQKLGVADKQGWAVYAKMKSREGRGASKTVHHTAERCDEVVFIKRFGFVDGAAYPDGGCNCETYTAATFIELESLGPMVRLEPGGLAEHVERWSLFEGVDSRQQRGEPRRRPSAAARIVKGRACMCPIFGRLVFLGAVPGCRLQVPGSRLRGTKEGPRGLERCSYPLAPRSGSPRLKNERPTTSMILLRSRADRLLHCYGECR